MRWVAGGGGAGRADNVMLYTGDLNAARPDVDGPVVWFWPEDPINSDPARDHWVQVSEDGTGTGGILTIDDIVNAPELMAAAERFFDADIVTLESSTDRLDDTKRLRITSSQKQEPENNNDGGETVWLDLADPRAKSMLTWRLRYNPDTRLPYAPGAAPADAPFRRVTWAGAHYYAQDQPDDNNPTVVHGHWSVEVPDQTGGVYTRFEVPFVDQETGVIGPEITNIQTNKADFTVRTDTGGVLRIGGPASAGNRDLVFASSNRQDPTKRRWILRTDDAQETGGSVGSNLRLIPVSDTGTEGTPSLTAERKTGRLGVGNLVSGSGTPQTPQATVDIRNVDGATNAPTLRVDGIAGQSAGVLTVNAVATTDRALALRLGSETQTRLAFLADGKFEWGDGTASRDTNLYRRAANLLATDDAFRVGVYTTAARPSAATLGAGAHIFDTTLNRPIWSNGTGWVDAMGNAV